MEGTKETGTPAGGAGRTRDEQATSDKTVADLERTQADKGGAASDAATSSPVEGSSPSPDGAFDSARSGRADGSDTGGPM